MYKIICDDEVISVVKSPVFMKYLGKPNKFAITDRYTADSIYVEDIDEIYMLEGLNSPSNTPYKTVMLQAISDKEFVALQNSLQTGEKVYTSQYHLLQLKESKINELKLECDAHILSGITVMLSDGLTHKFTLSIEDQLNLMSNSMLLKSGQSSFVYHESGKNCVLLSSEDMLTIITEANRHITYHTTYFNLMRGCIREMQSEDEIMSISYGMELPIASIRQLFKSFDLTGGHYGE